MCRKGKRRREGEKAEEEGEGRHGKMERKGEGRDGGGQGMGENVVEEKEWADEDRGVCGGGGRI